MGLEQNYRLFNGFFVCKFDQFFGPDGQAGDEVDLSLEQIDHIGGNAEFGIGIQLIFYEAYYFRPHSGEVVAHHLAVLFVPELEPEGDVQFFIFEQLDLNVRVLILLLDYPYLHYT